MKKIFICYRREDSEGYAGRLYDRLVQRFPERVFIDAASIPVGADFVEEIHKVIRDCFAVLVVIGPRWLNPGPDGVPRLRAPRDHVRLEIVEAFRSQAVVLPILIQGATMPNSADLPPGTVGLARRNAIDLRHQSFDADCAKLIHGLELLARTETRSPERDDSSNTGSMDEGSAQNSSASPANKTLGSDRTQTDAGIVGKRQVITAAASPFDDDMMREFSEWLATLYR